MSVCCECCVLSGKGLCDELITHPEESYRLRFVVVCDLETSRMRRPWPSWGCCAKNEQTYICVCVCVYIYIYIQGVPGGKDLTSGECSLGQTIPI